MPFQTSVNAYLAPGVVGGWASANPHVSLVQPNNGDLSDPTSGSWKVGTTGAIVGNFAFADVVTGLASNIHPGTGVLFSATTAGRIRVGFVQRDQVSLITTYLGEDTLDVQPGFGITLLAAGDVWALFAAGAAVGSFVFASYVDGSPVAGATSTPPTTATITADVTSGSANLANVSAALFPGQPIAGTGIPAGTIVVSYNATAGTAVMSQNGTATNAGVTLTVTTAALTPWRVDSLAGNGEIAKISVWG